MEQSKTMVAYITAADKSIETRTYCMDNANHKKELLVLLHQIACGLDRNMRVTFTTEC